MLVDKDNIGPTIIKGVLKKVGSKLSKGEFNMMKITAPALIHIPYSISEMIAIDFSYCT